MAKRSPRTGVTAAVLLDHMRGMEKRLTQRIDIVRNDLTVRMDRMENKVERVYVDLSSQIEGLDHRLDDIEVSQIPKLKKSVGMR
ncbi:MAG: hypothetical protein PHX93_02145 [Candidatus Peribacteraceae bacterium]|nr:hypothetical protein [Candidatus Peribacteraceae bacterium]